MVPRTNPQANASNVMKLYVEPVCAKDSYVVGSFASYTAPDVEVDFGSMFVLGWAIQRGVLTFTDANGKQLIVALDPAQVVFIVNISTLDVTKPIQVRIQAQTVGGGDCACESDFTITYDPTAVSGTIVDERELYLPVLAFTFDGPNGSESVSITPTDAVTIDRTSETINQGDVYKFNALLANTGGGAYTLIAGSPDSGATGTVALGSVAAGGTKDLGEFVLNTSTAGTVDVTFALLGNSYNGASKIVTIEFIVAP